MIFNVNKLRQNPGDLRVFNGQMEITWGNQLSFCAATKYWVVKTYAAMRWRTMRQLYPTKIQISTEKSTMQQSKAEHRQYIANTDTLW